MWKIILILLNFVFWILLVSSAFSWVTFWQWMDQSWLKDYYNSMSDKDISFSMGYVTYRNYMSQLKLFSIDTTGLITKVNYSNLKSELKNYKPQIIKANTIQSKKIINQKRLLKFHLKSHIK